MSFSGAGAAGAIMSTIPEWLATAMVTDTLPWEQSLVLSMPDFLAAYTLHDSSWGGLFLSPSEFYILLLEWDTIWSDGRVPYGTNEHPGAFPWLAIRFERVYHVQMSYKPDNWLPIVSHAKSVPLPDEQRTALFDSWNLLPSVPDGVKAGLLEESLLATTFYPAIGSEVTVLHAGETRLLCIDVEGRVLPIPFP